MPRSLPGRFVIAAVVMASVCFVRAAYVTEYISGITWDEPKVIQPDPVPSDAIVLFGGTDMSEWSGGENWDVKDGIATAQKNGITSKRNFGDCQLHVEWASPEKVEGSGQGRGNSGIYLMGKYEVQILDSFDNKTYFDGQCGAVYKQRPPMVNACRKPGEWQSYDILFTAPRFDDSGKVTKPAAVTVLQNGVVLHNHFELLGGTFYDRPPAYEKHSDKLPIHIQFHGNPVRFRNIWVRELADLPFKPKE
ncbi:MAG: DUF1080 domain-containing protein [Planctomycetaceae bacterium]|nr:DUF1080 domain-containing protein [Planctomycetaceae bacterium]